MPVRAHCGKPTRARSGLAHAGPIADMPIWAPMRVYCGQPTVGLPTENPHGLAKTHTGSQWVSPCGAHSSFAHLGPHEGLLWATHCGFAHRKPTRARSGLAHAGPIADLPIWAPMRVYCGQPTVGLPTENPHRPPERTRADGNHGNEETSSTDKQQKIASLCFSTAFSLENHHDVLLQPCPKTTSTAMNSTNEISFDPVILQDQILMPSTPST
ncbi:hypothetical protein F2P79_008466 [Pimephales promelas]|nr:hypothetical protein F2P79_008466 [Pimephales promelas]